MALKDLLSFIDDKLADTFHTQEYDPTKDRAKLVKRIEKTKEKFLATEPQKGRKDFSVANNVVEYSAPIAIGGKTTMYIPSERFAEFLDRLKKSVEAGELDDELEAANDGSTTATKTKRQRKSSGGWSEERRQKFEASIAARKATLNA